MPHVHAIKTIQTLTEGVDQSLAIRKSHVKSCLQNLSTRKMDDKMSQLEPIIVDQEPDTMAFIPANPDYFIVGTYSLLPSPNNDDNGSVSSGDTEGNRVGSLQIFPLQSAVDQYSQNWPLLPLDRRDFQFGVYDLHFHPKDNTLLGVATSNAEILFFRVMLQKATSGILTAIKLVDAGKIVVEEPHDSDGRLAIITQFQFLDLNGAIAAALNRKDKIFIAATTQFGNTKLIKVATPPDVNGESMSGVLDSQDINIHKQSYDLEAWTVQVILAGSSGLWLLSGGDDSQLIASNILMSDNNEILHGTDTDLDLLTPTIQYTDTRNHDAGVVYIRSLGMIPSHPRLPTPDTPHRHHADYLIATGSYDENFRVFMFKPPTTDRPQPFFKLVSQIHLGGGVWRIIPLDFYDTQTGRDYILLVAAHTAGACIVRLTGIATNNDWVYVYTVEKWFTEGHNSIVYAVQAKRAVGSTNTWSIISASFYDKVICEWTWTDKDKERRAVKF